MAMQRKGVYHLLGHQTRGQKAFRQKHVFANHVKVGHDHGAGAEQRLERLGQLGAPGVTGVHRDEYAHRVIQANI